MWVDEEEKARLTEEEIVELDNLRFRCYTDLPFGGKDYTRMQALHDKANE